jgi:glycerol-3-phosphate acyltransferase PlsX
MVYLKWALNRTWSSRIGAVLARGAFKALQDKMDPKNHNGGVFLGLNGIVVKSHGATDSFGFAAAVDVAVEMARNSAIDKIASDLAAMNVRAAPEADASAPAQEASTWRPAAP